jgi:Leucine-rich repeat (LRR) protein
MNQSAKLVQSLLLIASVCQLASCGSSQRGRLSSGEKELLSLESYCINYENFPKDARGDGIRYTIDRIKFVAGVTDDGAKGCIDITDALRRNTLIPEDPAIGKERYVFRLGARPKPDGGFMADPGDRFILSNLEPFTVLPFITELYLPHGKITDISPLNSVTELRILDVRNNQISELGSAISNSHIEFVDLSFNKLKSTVKIGGDFSLRYLDVTENPELTDVTNLKDKKNLINYFGPTFN